MHGKVADVCHDVDVLREFFAPRETAIDPQAGLNVQGLPVVQQKLLQAVVERLSRRVPAKCALKFSPGAFMNTNGQQAVVVQFGDGHG